MTHTEPTANKNTLTPTTAEQGLRVKLGQLIQGLPFPGPYQPVSLSPFFPSLQFTPPVSLSPCPPVSSPLWGVEGPLSLNTTPLTKPQHGAHVDSMDPMEQTLLSIHHN